jgi:hypothetical protein
VRAFDSEPQVAGLGPELVGVLAPLIYTDEEAGFSVLVPVGFVSDGPSVPRFGWPLVGLGFLALLPCGLIHDVLYRSDAELWLADGRRTPVPGRLWADRVMAESLRLRGGSWLDAWKVRAGLAVGGRGSWRRKPMAWRP